MIASDRSQSGSETANPVIQRDGGNSAAERMLLRVNARTIDHRPESLVPASRELDEAVVGIHA